MRIRHKLTVQISEDTDGKDLLLRTDDTLAEVVADDLTKAFVGILTTVAAATDTLSFGDVTNVLGLFLKVDTDGTVVTINGKDHVLKKRANASWVKLFLEEVITSLTVTAPAGSAIKGTYAVWGDLAT